MAVTLRLAVPSEPRIEAGVERTELALSAPPGAELALSAETARRVELGVGKRRRARVSSQAVTLMPSGETFAGPYQLTPTLEGFDLPTGGLFMRRDVEVGPIPISEATNASNGYTVIIG